MASSGELSIEFNVRCGLCGGDIEFDIERNGFGVDEILTLPCEGCRKERMESQNGST